MKKAFLAILLVTFFHGAARAELVTDTPGMTTLAEAKPYWVWVGGLGGVIALIDAADGQYLGTLSNGASLMKLDFPTKADYFSSTETHYSRGTRGARTDVVTLYDRSTLRVRHEIIVPSRTYDGMALMPLTALSDDEKFLYIFNMTPAQSVSVVNLHSREFVSEVSTPGCALIFPGAKRKFHLICGDGTLMNVTLDNRGNELDRSRSAVFFDANNDPIMEKGVRLGDRWLFPSFEGFLHEADVSGERVKFPEPWSLISAAEREAGWRVGGALPTAAHLERNRIYVLMHQGPVDTHKEPGNQVWEFDPVKRLRTRVIELDYPVTSIQVTQDKNALLVTASEEEAPRLDIYDLATGRFERSIEDLGTMVATLIQPFAR